MQIDDHEIFHYVDLSPEAKKRAKAEYKLYIKAYVLEKRFKDWPKLYFPNSKIYLSYSLDDPYVDIYGTLAQKDILKVPTLSKREKRYIKKHIQSIELSVNFDRHKSLLDIDEKNYLACSDDIIYSSAISKIFEMLKRIRNDIYEYISEVGCITDDFMFRLSEEENRLYYLNGELFGGFYG